MEAFYIYLFIAGLIGGFIAGLVGIGTGFLLVVIIPIALAHLGVPAHQIVHFTIANTIFATMCSSLMNNITIIRNKNFYTQESLWVATAAILTASAILHFFVMKFSYSKHLFNGLIILFLVYVVIRTIFKLRTNLNREENISKLKLGVTGMTGGLVAALTGLGGGSVVIPMLNNWCRIDIKKAKSITYTTIFSIAFMLTLINLFNKPPGEVDLMHYGYIIAPIVIPLSLGVVLAAPFGVNYSEKLSSRAITYLFLFVITLVLFRKIFEFFSEV